MANIIPMFPLSIVVFPGEHLNLHIFEPRYKHLVHDCFNNDLPFGIIPYLEGKSLKYGTLIKINQIAKTHTNGELDIRVEGISWFDVKDFYRVAPGKLYPGAEIVSNEWDDETNLVYADRLIGLIEELYKIMGIENVSIQSIIDFRTYQLAHKVGLNIDQELELLMIASESDRQLYLIEHLLILLPAVRQAELIRKRAALNGHFQNVIPPNF